MTITANMVKELREKTGAGIMDCKMALSETEGNVDTAIEFLRKKGLAAAQKKTDRIAAEGTVGHYIHAGGKIGVLVEVNCETDFVAKTDDFQSLVKDIAMHVAAANPLYINSDEVPAEFIEKEKSIYVAQAEESGKPANVVEKMVAGKLKKYLKEICLMDQPFVKDPDKTMKDLQTEMVAKLGEKISIRRFARFHLGEGIEKRQDNLQEEVAKTLAS